MSPTADAPATAEPGIAWTCAELLTDAAEPVTTVPPIVKAVGAAYVGVTVTLPVAALTLMPVPANAVTPVFVTVICVDPETEIAVPATRLFTPVADTVRLVLPDTLMPVPALTLLTPVALTVKVVVPAMDTPVPAASDAAIVGVVVPVPVLPVPAVTDVTPAAPPPLVPSGPDIVIRSPNRRR